MRCRSVSVVDDLTLLARAAGRGDRSALADLVRATQGDVWRLCAHLVDPGSADDLAQETYLRAIRALPGFRGDAPVRHWLLTIARRACAEEIGARQRGRRLMASLATGQNSGSEKVADASMRTELDLLLAALEPGRRAAFVLTQVLGCSYQEAASICGCPVGTIRSRVARARSDLIAMTTAPAGDLPEPAGPVGRGTPSPSASG